MSGFKSNLLGPWRRTFQWLTSLTILLLPFGSWNGRSLLRIDLQSFSLHIFGQTLRIEELYLVLFFSLALGVAFLLVTMVFGRVWCGWACPQTTLSDVAEWVSRKIGLNLKNNRLQGSVGQKVLVHGFYMALSLLVGANLVWYFIEPQRFFSEILQGQLHYGAWVSLFSVALTIYLDMALIRRVMCSEFCPYGRFQTVLADRATLTLHRPASEASRCIECGACVRCCPMEIDIRRGYQIECINCGRCLDACREVMVRLKQPGLIHYTFGLDNLGPRALFNPRTILLATAMSVLAVILVVSIWQRPEASLKISLSHTATTRLLDDGTQATFFTAWISNRGDTPKTFTIKVKAPDNRQTYQLKGQTVGIKLAPGENRGVQFVLLSPEATKAQAVDFILIDAEGNRLDHRQAQVSPI